MYVNTLRKLDVIYGNKEKECRKRGEVIRGMFCIVLEHHRLIKNKNYKDDKQKAVLNIKRSS